MKKLLNRTSTRTIDYISSLITFVRNIINFGPIGLQLNVYSISAESYIKVKQKDIS